MKRNLWAVLLMALLLSACGGSSGPTYTLGDLEIPALPTEEEPKMDVYGVGDAYVRTYTQFTEVETILPDYVTMLIEEYGFQTVTKALMTCPAPTEYGPEGDIYLGIPLGKGEDEDEEEKKEKDEKDGDDGETKEEKTILLEIVWSPEDCVVVSSIIPGPITETVNTVQVDAAQQYLEGMSPSDLGLSGASMAEYEVFAEDGGALVDGQRCLRFNVYQGSKVEDGSVFMGTYFISMDGKHLYQLDLDTNQVAKLADPELPTEEEDGEAAESSEASQEDAEKDDKDKKDKKEEKKDKKDKKEDKDEKEEKDDKEEDRDKDDEDDAASRMGVHEE